jgi:hypothetical protein
MGMGDNSYGGFLFKEKGFEEGRRDTGPYFYTIYQVTVEQGIVEGFKDMNGENIFNSTDKKKCVGKLFR